MKRVQVLVGVALAAGITLGAVGVRILGAQEPSEKAGTLIKKTELAGAAKGMEAFLVRHELPPGGESGSHTQTGNEVVYILEGSVVLEVKGKPAVTLKAGEAFTTAAGEVHNVKNASTTAPGKALAFYVAKKGTALEGLSAPAK